MKEALVRAIAEMEEDNAIRLAGQMLDTEDDPQAVLDACREAMTIVGQRFEDKEYYLPELLIAGEMMKRIGELAKPKLKTAVTNVGPKGKVVIGTVAGDIHDIGKDIVTFLLDVNDFEVHDLGVDVPAEAFVAKIREVRPEVVGMSGFLTQAFEQMKVTVEAIKDAGLRDGVKLMIGGAPMDDHAAHYVGADAFGADASAAVALAKSWTGR